MTNTVKEVLEFVEENDVRFIRLSFCDLFGAQKTISIMPDELADAFEHGISFDAYAIKGFSDITKSDLFLFPDPQTINVLTWRPGQGRIANFYCDIKNPDNSNFACDGRYVLKKAIKNLGDMGYVCKIGAECEFYLFKTDEDGKPTDVPLDNGGYFDIPPLDKGENIRREICISLKEMGINPETSHHEQGPGQNEIDFKFGDALACADNLLTFKSVVKTVAERNGVFASFMPKPIADKSGSGLHVNISLNQNGLNIFKNTPGEHSKAAESFMAGILNKTLEMTLFLNPNANSYDRFGAFEAPKYVSWSHQNRSQLIRIPAATGKKSRMELRSPDPSINPYLAFALIIEAGLSGIRDKLVLTPPLDLNLYTAEESVIKSLSLLPKNLAEAVEFARNSDFVKNAVGEEIFSNYLSAKMEEASDFAQAADKVKFYKERYFKSI